MPSPSVIGNDDKIGDGDSEHHHSLHCTNREIHTTILREFQQLTSHFDGRMLRQEELLKSLCVPSSNQKDSTIGPLPMDSMPRNTLSDHLPRNTLNSLRPVSWAGDPINSHIEGPQRLSSVTAPSFQPQRQGQSVASASPAFHMAGKTSYGFLGQNSVICGDGDGQNLFELQAMDYNYGQLNLNHQGKKRRQQSSSYSAAATNSSMTHQSYQQSDLISNYSRVTTAEQIRREKSYSMAAKDRLKNRVSQKTTLSQGPLRCNTISRHPWFEPLFACAVLLNSILIGFEVEGMVQNPGADSHWMFELLTNTFAFIFLVELSLRLCNEKCSFFTSGSIWNYLDAFLVLFSILEIVAALAASTTGTGQVGAANLRIVRLLRITKIIRVVRIIKVVRFIRALRKLVYAIASTLRSLLWAMLLLLMITYMFGIVYTQAAAHYMEDNPDIDEGVVLYWSTVPRSVFTLFKTVTGGVSWQDSVTPLAEIHWLCVMLFLSYITFMQFAMINVVTGVFCQSAIESASHDYELVVQGQLANKEMYIAKVEQLFNTMDKDGSGEVTMGEFENHLMDRKVQAYFASLELDSQDVWTLFKLLDMDESHVLDISEFLLGCLRLRGPAKAIDLAQMAYEHKIFRKRLYKFMDNVELIMGVPKTGKKLGTNESLEFNRDSRNSRMSRTSYAASSMGAQSYRTTGTLGMGTESGFLSQLHQEKDSESPAGFMGHTDEPRHTSYID